MGKDRFVGWLGLQFIKVEKTYLRVRESLHGILLDARSHDGEEPLCFVLKAVADVDLRPLPFTEKRESSWPKVALHNNNRIVLIRISWIGVGVGHSVSVLPDRPGSISTLDFSIETYGL